MLEPKTLRLKAHSLYWLVIDLNKLPSNQDYVVYIAEPNLTWKSFIFLMIYYKFKIKIDWHH